MRKKNVLITGGAGYIGSHTAKALAADGFVPVVVDTLELGHRSFVKRGPFIEGSIGNEALLQTVFAEYKFYAVMHFAGSAYVSGRTFDQSLFQARAERPSSSANCGTEQKEIRLCR
jgi:UDP-arabinose 4-epimerase